MYAKIIWLTKEQGGRKNIPWNKKYAPIVVLKGCRLNFQDIVWSLIVENVKLLSEYETIAEIHYLFENGADNLHKGIEFELYEGSKMVATGIVL